MTTPTTPYTGRFAPSPTGPLHFGSLVAAVGSYLQARHQQGRWLVRMEDLDPPREIPGAATDILNTLETYGFEWDGDVVYQSRCAIAYEAALQQLEQLDAIYACNCSRKDIETHSQHTHSEQGQSSTIYPGTCRDKAIKFDAAYQVAHDYAIRVRTNNDVVDFEDQLLGHYSQRLESDIGDFIIRRRDGLFAYQLAVVVDDAEQGITEIVRGSDLFDSTPRQIYLQQLLGLPTPAYLHLPIAVTEHGDKLSKRNFARALPKDRPQDSLFRALLFLGQKPPAELRDTNLDKFWEWAVNHWNKKIIPNRSQLSVEGETDSPPQKN